MAFRRPALLLRAALVALVLGGACSGGDKGSGGGSSASALLAAAPGKTVAAGSAKVSVHAAVEGQVQGSLTGAGELDLAGERGRLVLDLGPLGVAGAGETEVVFEGDVVFVKLGGAFPGLGSRPWLRVDLARVGGGPADSIEALRQLQTNYPTAVLNFLRGVEGDVTEVGREVVRGSPSTRYRATVDLAKAASASPPVSKEALLRVQRQLGTDVLPVEAWLDGDGRLRRLRYTIDLAELEDSAPAKGTGTGTSTTDLELFDFGSEIAFSAPPADEVTDLDALLGRGR